MIFTSHIKKLCSKLHCQRVSGSKFSHMNPVFVFLLSESGEDNYHTHASKFLVRPNYVVIFVAILSCNVHCQLWLTTSDARVGGQVSASERRGNTIKGFKDFCLKAMARIWP